MMCWGVAVPSLRCPRYYYSLVTVDSFMGPGGRISRLLLYVRTSRRIFFSLGAMDLCRTCRDRGCSWYVLVFSKTSRQMKRNISSIAVYKPRTRCLLRDPFLRHSGEKHNNPLHILRLRIAIGRRCGGPFYGRDLECFVECFVLYKRRRNFICLMYHFSLSCGLP